MRISTLRGDCVQFCTPSGKGGRNESNAMKQSMRSIVRQFTIDFGLLYYMKN